MDTQIVDFGTTDRYELANGKGRADFTVTTSDYDYEIRLTTAKTWKAKKTRFYVAGETEADFTEAQELSRLAGSYSRGVSPQADKAWDRGNREIVKNQRAVIEEALQASPLLRQIVGNHALTFSRKAGCWCPCSPGFISAEVLEVLAVVAGYGHAGALNVSAFAVEDIWVTRKAREIVSGSGYAEFMADTLAGTGGQP